MLLWRILAAGQVGERAVATILGQVADAQIVELHDHLIGISRPSQPESRKATCKRIWGSICVSDWEFEHPPQLTKATTSPIVVTMPNMLFHSMFWGAN